MTENKVGAVLVVGGGIGGMQTSLDLAESGFKVYLLDRKPNIGGMMSMLDKTFPTNDCSMCIIAPKLVDVGRNPNIEIISYADIERVNGKAGNFTVTIQKKARRVDPEKCTLCGDCAQHCPKELFNEYNRGMGLRSAVYIMYPQGIPPVYCIDTETPRCTAVCPAGIDVRGYISLIAEGNYIEALDLVRDSNPFASICGRVCHHPCEENCKRNWIDEPIAIMSLKRFVADYEKKFGRKTPTKVQRTREENVAIIGAGPAGLTAAYDLVKLGYGVTVFEKEDVPGGMIINCIPDYRSPKEELQRDIDYILGHGVELKTNIEIGKDLNLEDLKKQGFDAILVAVGSQLGRSLRIEGVNLDGVHIGLDFLRQIKSEMSPKIGKKVLIIGGGNVAIDCAKSAMRIGADEVHLTCLESRKEIPAHEWEVMEAVEEGVKLHPSFGPKRILGKNGKVTGMECIRVQSVFDEQGRFSPTYYDGTEFIFEGDTVIIAIGQATDVSFAQGYGDISVTPMGTISVDPVTFATKESGIFAAGDVVRGAASVVEAIADGHETAISIDRYLSDKNLQAERLVKTFTPEPERYISEDIKIRGFESEPRQKMSKRSPEKRVTAFKEIELGFTEEQALSEAERCLSCRKCLGCGICEEVCEPKAITYDSEDEVFELKVGSIILTPGFEEFDAGLIKEFGYKRYDNVVSSVEFERILSSSGPYVGTVIRPSDGEIPQKIAFIQCVGSRDVKIGNPWCSSVCCMYAIKEAVIAKEHNPNLDCSIFFMDMRAFGKEFDEYYIRAQEEYGVKFVRCRVSHTEEIPESKNLLLTYVEEDGEMKKEEFDIVVLSVGMKSPEAAEDLVNKFGIKLNNYNFCSTKTFSPLETSVPGIYVCGAFGSPKDIPDTVAQASGAAAKAASVIASERGKLVTVKEYPPERDVTDEEPRIGVFVCHCGINIGGIVDVPSVVEYAKKLPNVAYAEHNLYSCSTDTQERIKEIINEHNLNRVIVSSCTPRTHEPLFRSTLQEVGLNPYLFEMANIRDQCSWVHMHKPEEATEKARDLVRASVERASLLKPLKKPVIGVTPIGLVIGGGLSGMTAALELAKQGFETHLIEKEDELGGNLRKLHYMLGGEDPQEQLKLIIKGVEENKKIHVYKGAEITNINGYIGNFNTTLNYCGKEKEIEHGIVIIATGGEEYKPTEYLYGTDDRVMTQLELEEKIAKGEFNPGTVVMIQCVGARNEERPNCSRICCTHAVKNAIKLKELDPEKEVYILNKDIRTYGFKEDYYQEALSKGVVFLRYDDENKPEVTNNDGLKVLVSKMLLIEPDYLVLSAATLPQPGSNYIAQLIKCALSKDGFFLEAHMKLRPLDFATDGVFLCGLAHSPKFVDESISQACGAAARAATILSKETLEMEGAIATVDEDLCSGCRICEAICEYNAIEMKEDEEGKLRSSVLEALCKGCGLCGSTCPSGAITMNHFTDTQIIYQLRAALKEEK